MNLTLNASPQAARHDAPSDQPSTHNAPLSHFLHLYQPSLRHRNPPSPFHVQCVLVPPTNPCQPPSPASLSLLPRKTLKPKPNPLNRAHPFTSNHAKRLCHIQPPSLFTFTKTLVSLTHHCKPEFHLTFIDRFYSCTDQSTSITPPLFSIGCI